LPRILKPFTPLPEECSLQQCQVALQGLQPALLLVDGGLLFLDRRLLLGVDSSHLPHPGMALGEGVRQGNVVGQELPASLGNVTSTTMHAIMHMPADRASPRAAFSQKNFAQDQPAFW
jgi:hypothetical protein